MPSPSPDRFHAPQDRFWRVIDAALNRAREGARVVEDFCRFVLDAPELTQRLKDWRHRLAHLPWPRDRMVATRDTRGDVGTTARTEAEATRRDPWDIVRANLARTTEAVRTLEEFTKLLIRTPAVPVAAASTDPAGDDSTGPTAGPENVPPTGFPHAQPHDGSPARPQQHVGAARHESGNAHTLPQMLEALRYELYTLEQSILHRRYGGPLEHARLYLLLTAAACRHQWEHVLRQAVAGGVDLVQLREKELDDASLLDHARRVRALTRELGVPLIINDRPDIAALVDADGVHVGQNDLPPTAVRRLLGPDRWVGVSTHDLRQLREAAVTADYVGLGPCFNSATKSFARLAGLDFVRAAADLVSLPAFAIGGIGPDNVEAVLAAGARRIAVSSALCAADDPQAVARRLRCAIDAAVHRDQARCTDRH